MKYMLDTNICIYLIKKKPEKLLRKFSEYAIEEICISSMTIAEMEFGCFRRQYPVRSRIALTEFLSPFRVLDFDSRAAYYYGEIKNHLFKKGKPIGEMDTLIAGHAKAMGLTIITNNMKEFKRVPDLECENWTR